MGSRKTQLSNWRYKGRFVSEETKARYVALGVTKKQYESGDVDPRIRRAAQYRKKKTPTPRLTRRQYQEIRGERIQTVSKHSYLPGATTDGEVIDVSGLNAKDRQRASAYYRAARKAIDTNSDKPLRRWKGAKLGGYKGVVVYHPGTDMVADDYPQPIELADTLGKWTQVRRQYAADLHRDMYVNT